MRDALFRELAQLLGLYDTIPPRFGHFSMQRSGPASLSFAVLIIPRYRHMVRVQFHYAYGPLGWRIYDVSANGMRFSQHMRLRKAATERWLEQTAVQD